MQFVSFLELNSVSKIAFDFDCEHEYNQVKNHNWQRLAVFNWFVNGNYILDHNLFEEQVRV